MSSQFQGFSKAGSMKGPCTCNVEKKPHVEDSRADRRKDRKETDEGKMGRVECCQGHIIDFIGDIDFYRLPAEAGEPDERRNCIGEILKGAPESKRWKGRGEGRGSVAAIEGWSIKRNDTKNREIECNMIFRDAHVRDVEVKNAKGNRRKEYNDCIFSEHFVCLIKPTFSSCNE